MAKLTKQQVRQHRAAQDLLAQDRALTWDERLFVVDNWREDAEHANGEAGAFFTPWGLALDFAFDVTGPRVVDVCAGIGTLALAFWSRTTMGRLYGEQVELTCIERNPDYVAVGRKLLPEATWICGDALAPATWDGLGRFDTAMSNPPFGRIARMFDGPRYRGAEFEFHVADLATSKADHALFILPQASAGFRYSGAPYYQRAETDKYRRFHDQTGLHLDAGIGIDTSYEGYGSWHGTSPRVEIATLATLD